MSLLNQNRSYTVQDFLFIAAGLLGVLGFFMTYDSQDPRGMIHIALDESSAESRAEDLAGSLGFNTSNYRTQVNFGTNSRLLDSLQTNMGRQKAIKIFQQDSSANLYPYFWEVHFNQKSSVRDERQITIGSDRENVETGPTEFIIRYASSGEWVELLNGSDLIPEQQVNREALERVFTSDSLRQLLETLPDSLWHEKLSFNLDRNYNDTTTAPSGRGSSPGISPFTRSEVLRLGEYYIAQSGWELQKFDVANIRMETVGSTVVARIRYTSAQPIHGQVINLRASLTPTGNLLGLSASYNPRSDNDSRTPPLWELVQVAGFFLFGIGTIIIFYFRIRARVIDTKSALVLSILAGFTVPAIIFMNQINETNIFEEGGNWVDLVGLSLSMGITGAVASVSLFVLSAVGDSVTRQYWPGKLDCYDYLRQGMFFNKPVGEAFVRSGVLAFLLAGFWAVLLWFFPDFYFEIEEPILSYEVIWPPVYLLLDNLWYTLFAAFSIFLVVGSQTYAQTGKRWLAGFFMILAVVVAEPLPYTGGPPVTQAVLHLVFGLALTGIYLYWDFLTLLITYFLFNCLLVASSGWMMEGSPDFYVFLFYLVFLFLATGGGVFSILKGEEGRALPDFVPEYVEELAQEERIKQELQIARDVQQSFLPVGTPAIDMLDLAAICKPAYETGGDYYDFIQLDDHRLGVAIGDVSGKGIQAAFYMTFTKGILHTLCRETESPAEVLKKANKLFYDNARRGTFISLIYGIVDTRQKTFSFARAGHNPILHYAAEKKTINLLQPSGLGLGLTISDSFDNNIQEATLELSAGDLLVLYTDGVVESLNTAHQFYGTGRLQKLLGNSAKKQAPEILSDLVSDVDTFSGKARQHDDMTVMVIKLNNKS
ncbi:PP2C family protein-serine/threonine phosphatase [Halalkalibaculum sp. DA3122]|uniref:PP2C family protein-serine/threonine phosphatase n=1 Tax=Halalkalibaculum sp. DA3122 TaxID=3373607 RepID=UPI003754EED8